MSNFHSDIMLSGLQLRSALLSFKDEGGGVRCREWEGGEGRRGGDGFGRFFRWEVSPNLKVETGKGVSCQELMRQSIPVLDCSREE